MKNPPPHLDINHMEYHPLLQQLRNSISPDPESTNQKVEFFEPVPNVKLFVRKWTNNAIPSEKQMIVFHGAGGDSEYFVLLADQICQYGFEVIGLDHYGQGYSDGSRGDIKDFSVYYRYADAFIHKIHGEDPDKPLFLFGESMGGTVLINTLIEKTDLPPIAGLVMFAPGVKLRTASASLQEIFSDAIIGITYPFHPGRLAYKMIRPQEFNYQNGKPIMNPIHYEYNATNPVHWTHLSPRFGLQLFKGFSRALKKGPVAIHWPIIIFLGTNDIAIDRNAVEDFYQRIPIEDKKLILTENCPHAMFTFDGFQKYWLDLIDWLIKH